MRALIVDGSEKDRAVVAGILAAAGCDTDEAPDGVEAFECLLAQSYDLVVMEATLARLDTPDLIGKLRGRGFKTPVLVHTSITKSATLGALMKLGISDYVPKALPPDQVRQRILARVQQAAAPAASQAAASHPPPPSAPPSASPSAAQSGELGGPAGETAAISRPAPGEAGALLVETSEAEHQRWRAVLPAALGLDACKTFNEGLAHARHGHYRMWLVDTDAAVLNLGGLVAQARRLQPEAALIALSTLGKYDEPGAVRASLEALGFDEVVFKPLAADATGALVERYGTDWGQLVTVQDDLIEVSRLHYLHGQRDRYVHELSTRFEASVRAQSAACFDRVILDLTRVEQFAAGEAIELIVRVDGIAGALGVSLLVAVSPALCQGLRAFKESFVDGAFRWFDSAATARTAAAAAAAAAG